MDYPEVLDGGILGFMIEEQSFKAVWRNFATGVAIVTTIESNGRVHGMTANSIASISLNPPLIMASIGHDRESNNLIKETGRFAISILSDEQQAVALYYSAPRNPSINPPPVDFTLTTGGYGIVPNCLSFMECGTENHYEIGDHTIFIASINELGMSQGAPLTYYGGTYH
jgi:flavin reductase (DIM6/NTAB) family NADH-FMN oxidoreductase RutF